MSSLATTAATLGLYAVVVVAAALAARAVGRELPVLVLAAAALLPVVLLRPGLLAGKAPLGGDIAFLTAPAPAPPGPRRSAWLDDVARQVLPWHAAARRVWSERALPLRNRWNGCGMPLADNGSSAAYSPFTLLSFLLPDLAALSFLGAVRVLLAFTGFWLWLIELSVSPRAALFGSAAFAFSMAMTGWIFLFPTGALCLWPWVLFFLERTADATFGRRAFLGLVAALFLWPLSGHLETSASASAFTALWLAARAVFGDGASVRRLLSRLALAALLALGLSAFTLLPQALAIRDSNRAALVAKPFWAPVLSLAPHGPAWHGGVFTVLLPRFFGDKVEIPIVPGAAGAFPEMAQGYAGLAATVTAALFLLPGPRRRPAATALLAPLAFGLGAAIGLWPFAEIVSALPLLRFMFPLRYLAWFAFAASALAALAMDRFAEMPRRAALRGAVAATLGVALAGVIAWRSERGAYSAFGALTGERREFRAAAIALAVVLLLLVAGTLAKTGRATWLPLALAAVATADLVPRGSALYRWEPPDRLFVRTPLVEFLRGRPRPFRVVAEGAALFPNVGALVDLEDPRVHDPVERREYVAFLDATAGYPPAEYYKQIRNVDAPVLDSLNVRYLVAGPGREAPSAKWKRVYAGDDGTIFENGRARTRVFGDGATISEYEESGNRVSFRAVVSGSSPALLETSLAEPGGAWRARDETGAKLVTSRANGPFLALRVRPGAHRIRLDYAPPGFRVGAAVSLASALAAAALTGASRRSGSAQITA